MKLFHINIYIYLLFIGVVIFNGQLFAQDKTLGELFYNGKKNEKDSIFSDIFKCLHKKTCYDSIQVLYEDSTDIVSFLSLSDSNNSGFYIINRSDSIICHVVFLNLNNGSTNEIGDLRTSAIYLFYYKSCKLRYIIEALYNSVEIVFKVKDVDGSDYLGKLNTKPIDFVQKKLTELTMNDLGNLNLFIDKYKVDKWNKSKNITNF